MSKPLLTLPSQPADLYGKFSTYDQIRNQVKEQSQEENFKKHVIIFGLTWVTGDDGTFLTACTGEGELVVWKVPGIDRETRPIFRYETFVLAFVHPCTSSFQSCIRQYANSRLTCTHSYHIWLETIADAR